MPPTVEVPHPPGGADPMDEDAEGGERSNSNSNTMEDSTMGDKVGRCKQRPRLESARFQRFDANERHTSLSHLNLGSELAPLQQGERPIAAEASLGKAGAG